jgi:uncharacterized protein
MISGRCPICGKLYQIEKLGDLPSFPFCTDRCRMIDLGRWIDGDYAIPGAENASPEEPPDSDEE